jgi:hypothetical protein
LLSVRRMYGYWRQCAALLLIGNHDEVVHMSANCHYTACHRVYITLGGISQNAFDRRIIITAQLKPVFHILSPEDCCFLHLSHHSNAAFIDGLLAAAQGYFQFTGGKPFVGGQQQVVEPDQFFAITSFTAHDRIFLALNEIAVKTGHALSLQSGISQKSGTPRMKILFVSFYGIIIG